ncbi:MAG: DUF2339 domain-containing protein [Rikenellaceae bacterium]|nr:DUF2339 domain-containing protein [Rikenellaceae bacterium]
MEWFVSLLFTAIVAFLVTIAVKLSALIKSLTAINIKIDSLSRVNHELKAVLDKSIRQMRTTETDVKEAAEESKVTFTPAPAYTKPSPAPQMPPVYHARPSHTPAAPRKRGTVNYERFIGENLLGKIGILILVTGVGLFVKYYALEREWFGEVARTVTGFVSGTVLLGLSFLLRKRYRAFGSLLAGGGFAIFYVTVAVAFHYYGLFSQRAAFISLTLFTAVMALSAHLQGRRELAVTALAGGLISPFIVSTGDDNYAGLFFYLAILDAGMLALVLRRRWGELAMICFAGTWLTMLIYTLGHDSMECADHASLPLHLALFALGFFLLFSLSAFAALRSNERSVISRLLTVTFVCNNFIFAAFGLFFLNATAANYDISDNIQGLCTLIIALVNAALHFAIPHYCREGNIRNIRQLSAAMAILFITLTIPAGMSGHLTTSFWAVEAAVLAWLYKKSGRRLYGIFATALIPVALISYVCDLVTSGSPYLCRYDHTPFVTPLFTTGAIVTACTLLFGRFMRQGARFGNIIPAAATVLALAVACLAPVWELCTTLSLPIVRQMLSSVAISTVLTMFLWHYRHKIDASLRLAAPATAIIVLCVVSQVRHYPPIPYLAGNLLQWLAVAAAAALLYLTIRMAKQPTRFFTVTASAMFITLMVMASRISVSQLLIDDEASAALSVSLVVSGALLMWKGMKGGSKTLRMVSLAVFAVVLGKLAVHDIWLMNTAGKVVVFVLSGAVLLSLSFLYQKLKSALFDK